MKSLFPAIFFLISFPLAAQQQATKPVVPDEPLPYENIYLQTDQSDYYIAGETIWFKAYLYSPFVNSQYSTTLYVELLDEQLRPVLNGKFLIDGGVSAGQLQLPGNLPQGAYLLRAYTMWSLNFGDNNIYKKGIMVFNPLTAEETAKHKLEYFCRFYPESGNIVYELQNLVAFRITASEFIRQSFRGAVVDQDGKELFRVSTDSMGRGQFNFQPGKGNKYRLRLQIPGQESLYFEFPEIQEKGVLLHTEDRENDKSFRISRLDTMNKDYDSLLLRAVMHNRVVFEMDINMKGEKEVAGAMLTELLPPGILQLLLYDSHNELLASRNVWIDHNYEPGIKVEADTFSLKPKSLNVLNLEFADSLSGEFSLSVTAIGKDSLNKWNDNIIEGLFIQPGNREMQTGFDESLSGKGKDLAAITADRLPAIPKKEAVFKEVPYIRIRGGIGMPLEKLKNIPTEITFIVQTKDSVQTAIAAAVSPAGSFELNNLVYTDTAQFFYQFRSSKPIFKKIPVRLEMDTVIKINYQADYSAWFRNAKIVMENVAMNEDFRKSIVKKYRDISIDTAKGIMLEEVLLKKTRTPSQISKVNKEYTSGIFSAMGFSYNIDLESSDDAKGYQNIFDYLRGRVPGLIINRTATGQYVIESARSHSTLDVLQGGNGLVDGQVYLNEVPVSTDQIAFIPVSDVALVKFYPPGRLMALSGSGISCILVIYTKKGSSGIDDRKYLRQFKYPGYTETRDFVPGRTLYWDPSLSLEKKKELRIRFHNTEGQNGYRIVLEGITTDGKAVHFEKMFK